MTDFTFQISDFNSTEITIIANTQDAKEYLAERYGIAVFLWLFVNLPRQILQTVLNSSNFLILKLNGRKPHQREN
jgi:hypothetical protein